MAGKIALSTGGNQERGNAVIEAIKKNAGNAIFIRADISVSADCRDQTVQAYERLTILFKTAGVFYLQTTREYSEGEWTVQIDVNPNGISLMSKFALPTMIAQTGA